MNSRKVKLSFNFNYKFNKRGQVFIGNMINIK